MFYKILRNCDFDASQINYFGYRSNAGNLNLEIFLNIIWLSIILLLMDQCVLCSQLVNSKLM